MISLVQLPNQPRRYLMEMGMWLLILVPYLYYQLILDLMDFKINWVERRITMAFMGIITAGVLR